MNEMNEMDLTAALLAPSGAGYLLGLLLDMLVEQLSYWCAWNGHWKLWRFLNRVPQKGLFDSPIQRGLRFPPRLP